MIRNLSISKKTEAHILMRNYMMDRLLERISLSPYKNKFILKGGMLVAAMISWGEVVQAVYKLGCLFNEYNL